MITPTPTGIGSNFENNTYFDAELIASSLKCLEIIPKYVLLFINLFILTHLNSFANINLDIIIQNTFGLVLLHKMMNLIK